MSTHFAKADRLSMQSGVVLMLQSEVDKRVKSDKVYLYVAG